MIERGLVGEELKAIYWGRICEGRYVPFVSNKLPSTSYSLYVGSYQVGVAGRAHFSLVPCGEEKRPDKFSRPCFHNIAITQQRCFIELFACM